MPNINSLIDVALYPHWMCEVCSSPHVNNLDIYCPATCDSVRKLRVKPLQWSAWFYSFESNNCWSTISNYYRHSISSQVLFSLNKIVLFVLFYVWFILAMAATLVSWVSILSMLFHTDFRVVAYHSSNMQSLLHFVTLEKRKTNIMQRHIIQCTSIKNTMLTF